MPGIGPFEELRAFRCDDHDFDMWVKQQFPQAADFEFAPTVESGNDQSFEYRVDTYHQDRWSDYDRKRWEDFMQNGKVTYAIPRMILEWMVSEGQLQAGLYIIRVSW